MIEIEELSGRVVVTLPEEFSYRMYREFRDIYQHRKPGVQYDIDFNLVKIIDSSALGMLLLMYEFCKGHDSRIRLLRCSSRIAGVLVYSSIDTLFEIDQNGV